MGGVQQQLADIGIRTRGLAVPAWPRSHAPTLAPHPHNEVASLQRYLGTAWKTLRYHLERRCSCERILPPASTRATQIGRASCRARVGLTDAAGACDTGR